MTLNQFISLVPRVVKYNMKIIFAGKFIWFLLAAFGFYAYFMFQNAWNRNDASEALIYSLLLFPSLLLVFYPTVFGIQNDEDSRILEILFGIPNYRYKVWGVRLFMIYLIVFAILVVFAAIGTLLLYPVNAFGMAIQLMFPILFMGNMAFMFSTITRSGNGTAVIVIILSILLLFLSEMPFIRNSFWDIWLNPFRIPGNFHPMIWEGVIIKSRIFLFIGGIVWLMIGSLNLQKREKFV